MSLEQLREDGVIDEVLARLKSGKEADVWLVRHGEQIWAAKVYKDRATRSFKNSSGYKEGRTVRNSRTQRAMDRGSKFGQAAAEEEWKSAESDALHKLHAQGVRVPTPVLFYEGILLMELVLDEGGHPAPRLIDALIPPEVAGELYADLRAQAIGMLCCDLIHGDLSPYNVLLGVAGPTIIDFPQVVGASHNSQAQEYFTRDIENLRLFFASADPKLEGRRGDAAEIWQAYVRRDLAPDFVPTGRAPPPPRQAHQPHGGHARHEGGRAHGGQQRPAPHAPARPQGGGHPAQSHKQQAAPAHGTPRRPEGHGHQAPPHKQQAAPAQGHPRRPERPGHQGQSHKPQAAPAQGHPRRPESHGPQASPQRHQAAQAHGAPRTQGGPGHQAQPGGQHERRGPARPASDPQPAHGAPRQPGAGRDQRGPGRQHGAPRQHQGPPRPPGNPQPAHAPRPQGAPPPAAPRGQRPPRQQPRPGPVVERVVRPAHPPGRRHGRPAPRDPPRNG